MNSSGIIKPDPTENVQGDVSVIPPGAFQALRRTPPAVLSSTPNPIGLVMALRRRWWLALGLALLGSSLTATGMWFMQKSTFTARALVHVQSNHPKILENVADTRTNFSDYQRSQVALVKSRRVLTKALEDSKVSNLELVREQVDPIVWLESQIRADFSMAPEILRIAMNGHDPKAMTAIVDSVSKVYLKDIVYREHNQRMERLATLRKLSKDTEDKLADSRKTIQLINKGLGSKDPEARAMILEYAHKELSHTDSELLKYRFELLKARMEAPLLPTKDDGPPKLEIPKDVFDDHLRNEPEYAVILARVLLVKSQIRHSENNAKDPKKEVGYEANKKALLAGEKELEALREKLYPKVLARITSDGKSPFAGDKQSIEFLKNFVKELDQRQIDQRKALARLKEDIVSVEYMSDDLAHEVEALKKISTWIFNLDIELQAPQRINPLEDAIVVPDTDGRIKKCATGGAGAFALILFGVALLEFRQRRVNNVDEVVRGLDMRLMGTLPAIPSRARRQLSAAGQSRDAYWQNILTESVDSARTMLLHMAKLESKKVVMITSAVGGEGKTLLSCHLAISLARAGYRTLLVDCDLRGAAVHKVFGLVSQPGFSDLLTGEADVAATLQAGPLPDLWVLAAGQSNAGTGQALAQHRSKAIFKQLKDQFDFVLVDSAPILPVADTLLIAPCVDAVILSILQDVSRLPSVYAAYERLAALRVHFLGAVVNGAAGDYYRSRYPYQGTTSD